MVASFRCCVCAAVLLLHLLALLLAIVVTVVVNLSAVRTSHVAVIVIVTVMYPQWMLPVDCWLMVGCYMVAAGCCLSRSVGPALLCRSSALIVAMLCMSAG